MRREMRISSVMSSPEILSAMGLSMAMPKSSSLATMRAPSTPARRSFICETRRFVSSGVFVFTRICAKLKAFLWGSMAIQNRGSPTPTDVVTDTMAGSSMRIFSTALALASVLAMDEPSGVQMSIVNWSRSAMGKNETPMWKNSASVPANASPVRMTTTGQARSENAIMRRYARALREIFFSPLARFSSALAYFWGRSLRPS